MIYFLSNKTKYKNLENKETAVNEVSGYKTSIEIIDKAINRYIEKFCRWIITIEKVLQDNCKEE